MSCLSPLPSGPRLLPRGLLVAPLLASALSAAGSTWAAETEASPPAPSVAASPSGGSAPEAAPAPAAPPESAAPSSDVSPAQVVAVAPSEPNPRPAVAADSPPAPASPPVAARPSRVPAYTTLGLAGAGLVSGAFFGWRALDAKGDYSDAPSRKLLDRVETNSLLSDMCFALGLTLGITGTVLLLDEPEAPLQAGRPRLLASPYVTPEGAGAGALLRF